jgi:hypothetical protein
VHLHPTLERTIEHSLLGTRRAVSGGHGAVERVLREEHRPPRRVILASATSSPFW